MTSKTAFLTPLEGSESISPKDKYVGQPILHKNQSQNTMFGENCLRLTHMWILQLAKT